MHDKAFAAMEQAAPDRLSVGLSGDVPVFPPFFALGVVCLALCVQLVVGRWRFLPWPFSAFFVRVAIFSAIVALFVTTKSRCEEEMLKGGTYLHFTAVKRLVTSGPFEVSRNPLYVAFSLLIPGLATLLDSFALLIATPLVPVYLDAFVVPKEEQLLARIFPAEYARYKATVPRWL
ncbi:hypothetical protein KFE25_006230 [Diacronema lutheri]|uniref:Protein-S-isoprenylcysteine O-methyltransferase n=1 Tax=Diacronema lutheri TaxID=2081491 RepID=A0A7R9UVW5_DIALT|nr:hypothetical protein KFE25_006230 [Diacronema lutheri]